MPPNWTMGGSYGDDRRNSAPRASETYRSAPERDRPPLPRRDSRDTRDFRDFRDAKPRNDLREPRSPPDSRPPRDYRRENEPSRPLRIDTNPKTLDGPRRAPLSDNSPGSAVNGHGDEAILKAMKTGKSSIKASAGDSSALPKAKNPELQEAFECAYRWGEESSRRLLLIIRKANSVRENNQRRLENEKTQAKASRFLPYSEIGARFAQKDTELDDQLRAREESYLQELEQLVSRFASAKSATNSVPTTAQDARISALEAKMTEMSQMASKQSDQIKGLLEADEMSRRTTASLERKLESIRTENESLKETWTSLKSDRESLKATVAKLQEDLQSLMSQQVKTENENKSLKQHLKNIQTGADKAFEARLLKFTQKPPSTISQAELVKAKADIASLERKLLSSIDTSRESRETLETSLGEQIKNLEAGIHERMLKTESGLGERITNLESDLNEQTKSVGAKLEEFNYGELKHKLDELDVNTLNDVCEAWVASEPSLKALYAEFRDRERKNPSSDTTIQPTGQTNTNDTLLSQQIDAIVNAQVMAKMDAVERSINEKTKLFSEEKDKMLVEVIEGALSRITDLEATKPLCIKTEARVQLLEQWKDTTPWLDQKETLSITERPGLLEGKSAGPRMKRIELEVGELSKKVETVITEVGQLVKREWVELRLQEALVDIAADPGVSNQVKDVQRRTQSLEQAIKVLDSQFQNLSTKQLAEHIAKWINTSVEQRLAKLESKSSQLDGKAAEFDKLLIRSMEAIQQIQDSLERMNGGKKRTASPSMQEEMNKKRRLETNGRHPSPLQQLHYQQQQQQQQQQQPQQQQLLPPQQSPRQPPNRLPNTRQPSS